MLKTEAVPEVEAVDRGIAAYMAQLAGKSPDRFCAPSILDLQRTRRAAFAKSPEFIRERLEHLVAIDRIQPAVRIVKGEPVSGYIVLPERLWRREKQPKLQPASSELTLTAADFSFLKACGISTD